MFPLNILSHLSVSVFYVSFFLNLAFLTSGVWCIGCGNASNYIIFKPVG